MQISYLADRPELAAGLIPGLLAAWRHLLPEDSWEARAARLARHMNREALPIAWVAHDGGDVWGTAALRATDIPEYEHYTPWLGGVYVRPELRGRGVASALCRAVEAEARRRRFERLYLFTLDRQSLYARLGWTTFERGHWCGREGDLMIKHLA